MSTVALDSTKKYGEKASETADLYFAYGKALLENAIAQSSVLGKQEPDDALLEDNNGAYACSCVCQMLLT